MWLFASTALAPLIWGSTYFVTTTTLAGWSPLWVAALRALPVGLLLVLLTRTPLPRAAWIRTATLGVLNIGVFWALLFVAVYRLPGGVAATVGAINPMIVALLAGPLLSERLRTRTLLAALLGLCGVALVVLGPAARLDGLGILAAVGANLSAALGAVLTRRWGAPSGMGVWAFTGWQLSFGGLFLLVGVLGLGTAFPVLEPSSVGGLLYLGLIGAGLTVGLWVRGLALLPASRVAILGLLSPLTALSLDVLLLGKTFSGVQLLGVALVLGSIALEQVVRGGPPQASTVRPPPKAPSDVLEV